MNPNNVVGAILGAAVVFFFSGLAISAVSRAAGRVVFEVREQFRTKPGIMDYSEKPDYGAVVDICTKDSLRELATPGLLAVLAPVAVGFGLGIGPLAAYLVGAIAAGTLMAVFLSNSGGAWDNAKKMVEDGAYGGKGSEAHAATVIGDTVGDPFKDTAGPAINPLIKVMNLVALIIAPAVVSLSVGEDANDGDPDRDRPGRDPGHRGRRRGVQAPLGRGRRGRGRAGRGVAHHHRSLIRPPRDPPARTRPGGRVAACVVDACRRCGRRRPRRRRACLASPPPVRTGRATTDREAAVAPRISVHPEALTALADELAGLASALATDGDRCRSAAGSAGHRAGWPGGRRRRRRRHRLGGPGRCPRRRHGGGGRDRARGRGRLPRRGRGAGRAVRDAGCRDGQGRAEPARRRAAVTAPVGHPDPVLRLQAVAGWDVASLRAGLRAVTALDEGFPAWRSRLDAVVRDARGRAAPGPGRRRRRPRELLLRLSSAAAALDHRFAASREECAGLVREAATAAECAATALALARELPVPLDAALAAEGTLAASVDRLVLGPGSVPPAVAMAQRGAGRRGRGGGGGRPGGGGAGARRHGRSGRRGWTPSPTSTRSASRRPRGDPAATARWWAALPGRRPAGPGPGRSRRIVGSSDGVPAWARDRANRAVLEQVLGDPRRRRGPARHGAGSWPAVLAAEEAAGRVAQLHLLDLAGDRVAVSFGDLDAADAVALVVPGVGTSPADDLAAVAGDARDLAAAARRAGPGRRWPTVAWLGYRAPHSCPRCSPAARPAGEVPLLDAALAGLAGGAHLRRSAGCRGRRSWGTATARWCSTRRPTGPAGWPPTPSSCSAAPAWRTTPRAWRRPRCTTRRRRPTRSRGAAGSAPRPGRSRFGSTGLPADAGTGHSGYFDRDRPTLAAMGEVVAGRGPADPIAGGPFPPPGTAAQHARSVRRTARPREVVPGPPVGQVAYRGPPRGLIATASPGAAPGQTSGTAPHAAPARPEHHRQEHRAHEDHAHRRREHRAHRRGQQAPSPQLGGGRWQAAGHRGVADQGDQDRRLPGQRLRRRGQRRAHPRPAAQRRRRPGRAQGRLLGPARRRRRQLLRAALRGQPRPQAAGQPAQAAGEGRQRDLPRDGRGPRGRGHRLAPDRHPQAAGPGPPDGLPRDHPRGDRPRRRQPARAGHRAGRRPGDPPHPRPALRLRGQPRAVEEGAAQALGRPRAVGGHPHRGRARARADGLPRRRLLVAGGHLRRPGQGGRRRRGRADHRAGQAGQRRRQPGRHRAATSTPPPAG